MLTEFQANYPKGPSDIFDTVSLEKCYGIVLESSVVDVFWGQCNRA